MPPIAMRSRRAGVAVVIVVLSGCGVNVMV
jgi:hypothetical protein